MHEHSIVRSLLKQVDDIARREGGTPTEVYVTVGEFSGVDAALLQLAFEQLAPESPAGGARLNVTETGLQARCESCGREFAVQSFRFVCPDCSATEVRIVRGEELILERVTLEAQ